MTPKGSDRSSGSESTSRPETSFKEFLGWLMEELGGEAEGLATVPPSGLFSWGEAAGISEEDLVRRMAEFCELPYVRSIERDDVDFDALPRPYCQSKLVVPVRSVGAAQTLVVSNAFDWELLDDLRRTLPRGRKLTLLLGAPQTLRAVLSEAEVGVGPGPRPTSEGTGPGTASSKGRLYDPEKDPGKNHPVAKLAMDLLFRAVSAGASDLILEPKKSGTVSARAVTAGDAHDLQDMPDDTGRMLVARFKSLSGMDVTKTRTPQRGRVDVVLRGNTYKLRLVTAPTPSVEKLSLRVLDLSRKPETLQELGMTPAQAETLLDLARQKRGLILFAGPVGSGKTTTLYSLLSAIEGDERTVASVEDPVECRLPWIHQKDVQEEGDGSVDALLQASMKEEPDILFLSEIGGLVSATACVEYAGAGHLVLVSMNTSNCSTAIFRLERLGVSRSALAGSLTGIVTQRLLKKLCPECREVQPLSAQEASFLQSFTDDLPAQTAHPSGCSACRGTGYRGREAVFEVIRVLPEMAQKIQEGEAVGRCREVARQRGVHLVSDHAIQRVQDLVFSLDDVYREVLLEELTSLREAALATTGGDGRVAVTTPASGEESPAQTAMDMAPATILVVDDDEDTRFLLDRILSVSGFRVIQATDGGEALLKLGREPIDLIVSDIHMPNLGGLKLLEILHQHRIDAPVILLTGEPSPEIEARCLEMGAVDYLRKPIQKPVLLARIRRALEESPD